MTSSSKVVIITFDTGTLSSWIDQTNQTWYLWLFCIIIVLIPYVKDAITVPLTVTDCNLTRFKFAWLHIVFLLFIALICVVECCGRKTCDYKERKKGGRECRIQQLKPYSLLLISIVHERGKRSIVQQDIISFHLRIIWCTTSYYILWPTLA